MVGIMPTDLIGDWKFSIVVSIEEDREDDDAP
jgi:hypothetical protein